VEEDDKLIEAIESVRRDKKDPWKYILFTFVNGIAYGLGLGLGMTLILGIALFILTQIIASMVNFPVIGNFFEQLGVIIESYGKQLPKR